MIYIISGHSEDFSAHRTFGYFLANEEHEAITAATENHGNMHENLYVWLVIEEVSSGIHSHCNPIKWYQWVGKWVECKKPEKAKNLCNFCMMG